jgi:hypothetical protein
LLRGGVASTIARQLGNPVRAVSVGLLTPERASMLMPKATVNEYHLLAGWKHEVRGPGQVAPIESVTVAHLVNEPPHRKLGLRILFADTTHMGADFLRCSFRHAVAAG